jgi:hypothetical protein
LLGIQFGLQLPGLWHAWAPGKVLSAPIHRQVAGANYVNGLEDPRFRKPGIVRYNEAEAPAAHGRRSGDLLEADREMDSDGEALRARDLC